MKRLLRACFGKLSSPPVEEKADVAHDTKKPALPHKAGAASDHAGHRTFIVPVLDSGQQQASPGSCNTATAVIQGSCQLETVEGITDNDLVPLATLGEGAFGTVSLCRVLRCSLGRRAQMEVQSSVSQRSTSPTRSNSWRKYHVAPAHESSRPYSKCASSALSTDLSADSSPDGSQRLLVAVKQIRAPQKAQTAELACHNECSDCPFVLRVLGSLQRKGACSLLLEYAAGGDLGALIATLAKRRGATHKRLLMSEANARFYIGCIIKALEHIHMKGMLHRDVKMENLLLCGNGLVKLADFGMACKLDEAGNAAGRCGTPSTMAPEVWRWGSSRSRLHYNRSVDLWSVGVVLYQLLTGTLPARSPEAYTRITWRLRMHSSFSPELRHLLRHLLALKPKHRMQSCREVMMHPWFAGFDWVALQEGRLPVPHAHLLAELGTFEWHEGKLPRPFGRPASKGVPPVAGTGSSTAVGILLPPLVKASPPACPGRYALSLISVVQHSSPAHSFADRLSCPTRAGTSNGSGWLHSDSQELVDHPSTSLFSAGSRPTPFESATHAMQAAARVSAGLVQNLTSGIVQLTRESVSSAYNGWLQLASPSGNSSCHRQGSQQCSVHSSVSRASCGHAMDPVPEGESVLCSPCKPADNGVGSAAPFLSPQSLLARQSSCPVPGQFASRQGRALQSSTSHGQALLGASKAAVPFLDFDRLLRMGSEEHSGSAVVVVVCTASGSKQPPMHQASYAPSLPNGKQQLLGAINASTSATSCLPPLLQASSPVHRQRCGSLTSPGRLSAFASVQEHGSSLAGQGSSEQEPMHERLPTWLEGHTSAPVHGRGCTAKLLLRAPFAEMTAEMTKLHAPEVTEQSQQPAGKGMHSLLLRLKRLRSPASSSASSPSTSPGANQPTALPVQTVLRESSTSALLTHSMLATTSPKPTHRSCAAAPWEGAASKTGLTVLLPASPTCQAHASPHLHRSLHNLRSNYSICKHVRFAERIACSFRNATSVNGQLTPGAKPRSALHTKSRANFRVHACATHSKSRQHCQRSSATLALAAFVMVLYTVITMLIALMW